MESSRLILERRLRQAIIESLHELVPEFRSHVDVCPNCGEFHDWVTWQHEPGASHWRTVCPNTGDELILPLEFRNAAA